MSNGEINAENGKWNRGKRRRKQNQTIFLHQTPVTPDTLRFFFVYLLNLRPQLFDSKLFFFDFYAMVLYLSSYSDENIAYVRRPEEKNIRRMRP